MVVRKILITGVRLYCKKLFYIKEKTISEDGLFFLFHVELFGFVEGVFHVERFIARI